MRALQFRIVDGKKSMSLCFASMSLSLLHLDNTHRPSNMPRDMSGTGRYPPVPKHQPTEFYGSVRLGDPERLFHIMSVDPYFLTQNNGAGAPIHFATTYKQLDMLHHLLNNGAEINQRDDNGLTALHRAAHLAQYDGYLQIYEFLLVGTIDRVNCGFLCLSAFMCVHKLRWLTPCLGTWLFVVLNSKRVTLDILSAARKHVCCNLGVSACISSSKFCQEACDVAAESWCRPYHTVRGL